MDLPFVVHGQYTNEYTYKSVMDPHVGFHATPPKDIDRKIDVTHGDDDAYTRIVIARVNIDAIGASNRYPEIDDLYPRTKAKLERSVDFDRFPYVAILWGSRPHT